MDQGLVGCEMKRRQESEKEGLVIHAPRSLVLHFCVVNC